VSSEGAAAASAAARRRGDASRQAKRGCPLTGRRAPAEDTPPTDPRQDLNKRRPVAEPKRASLLHASPARVGLGLIHHHAVIEVADTERDVVHQLRDFAHVLVVDVLGLVGQLVIVHVQARREERDRNPVARVLVVVAPAVDALRMSIRVEGVVEAEGSRLALVYRLHDVTQLGREAAPGGSGEETLRKLKTMSQTSDIPVIILSGSMDAKGQERVRVLGASAVLLKPMVPEQLFEALAAAL
jgi:CheY-like chemotaxis protein